MKTRKHLIECTIDHYQHELNAINELAENIYELQYSAIKESIIIKQELLCSFLRDLKDIKENGFE